MIRDIRKICLVSPYPPPYGGMAIQARKLIQLLEEAGFEVNGVRTNTRFPASLHWATRLPGLRTLINHVLFMRTLHQALKQADVVYFLSGFISFFWLVTYPALVLIKLSGKPVILSARGGDARRFFDRWGRLVGPIIRRVDVITTP